MNEELLVGLTAIVVLGIGAQWLAWRLRLPAILLLLVTGLIAGPATGFLDPDALLGDVFFPLVSISVAVILFEGGLSLRVVELREIGGVVRNLVTIGALAGWLLGAVAAHFFLGLEIGLALLLGAILVVSGPTVIVPLLRSVRPTAQVGSILRWEGIVIDPIGALLAVLVFEAIRVGDTQGTASLALSGILQTALMGGVSGILGALMIVLLLKRYWIPDFLHETASLMLVVGVFTASNLLQSESGLLAVTVMGLVLANQKTVTVKHIIEFKENLRILLISSLFILLAARLRPSDLAQIGVGSVVFLVVLIFVVRPLVVGLCSLGSKLTWRERLFLAAISPRGIVAAAVSSVLGLELAAEGHADAAQLAPLTFLVIIGTVAFCGLTASSLARRLGVAQSNPQGALIVGGHSWARTIAAALQAEGFRVLLVDTFWSNVRTARMDGLPIYYGSILSDYVTDQIELEENLEGIGRLLALTSNNELNALAAMHFAENFGRENVYQLCPEGGESGRKAAVSRHRRGRFLFGPQATYFHLTSRFASGAVVKTTKLTAEFDYEAFRALYGENAIPLFLIDESGKLEPVSADGPLKPVIGQTMISLVDPVEETPPENATPAP